MKFKHLLKALKVSATYLKSSNSGNIFFPNIVLAESNDNSIIKDNKAYQLHPTDYIHGLLSSHSYKDVEQGQVAQFGQEKKDYELRNEYLKNWRVEKVIFDNNSGYYGVIYVNDKDKQVVLAHRGTKFDEVGSKLFTKDSPLKTDIKGILEGQIVPQQAQAYEATKQASDYIKEVDHKDFQLSITGHSLGAWLAEQSVYFCRNDFGHPRIKAVTFDSPGTREMMVKFNEPYVQNKELQHKSDPNNLDIVTYLSSPNIINSCSKHVGTIYRVFPEIPKPEWVNKILSGFSKVPLLSNWTSQKIKDNEFVLDGILSISGHKLDLILDTFDPALGKPNQYKKVEKWPHIKYDHDKNVDWTISGLFNALGKTYPIIAKLYPVAGKNIEAEIKTTTISCAISTLCTILNGGANMDQYWKTYELIGKDIQHLEQKNNEKENIKQDLSCQDQFSLTYEGCYKVTEVNLYNDMLSKDKYPIDYYLEQLKKCTAEKLGNSAIGLKLQKLKKEYEVDREEDGSTSISSETYKAYTIEELRSWGESLKKQYPTEFSKILSATDTIHAKNVDNKFESYITLSEDEIKNFVGRDKVTASISELLETHQQVIVKGVPGVGKSSIGYKYAKQERDSGSTVYCFNADSSDKVYESYLTIAKQLNVISKNLPREEVISTVNIAIAKNYKNENLLFVFDNAENYEDIAKYTQNLPPQVKVIITTRHDNLKTNLPSVQLESFTQNEAKSYITQHLSGRLKDEQESEELIKKVGLIPRKLSLAVSYLQDNESLTIKEYIKEGSAKVEWDAISYLQEKSPIGWQMLQYAAYLDPDYIDQKIFEKIFSTTDLFLREESPINWQVLRYAACFDQEYIDKNFFEQICSGLASKTPAKNVGSLSLMSVIYKNGEPGFMIHRETQEEIKRYLANKGINNERVVGKLLEVMDKIFPKVDCTPKDQWIQGSVASPHVEKLIDTIDRNEHKMMIQAHKICYFKLCDKLGQYYKMVVFNNQEALKWWQKGLHVCQEVHSDNHDHPDIEGFYNEIGLIYGKLGQRENEIEYLEKSLKLNKLLYQGNHEKKAESLYNLGGAYIMRAKPDEKEMIRKGLEYLEEAKAMISSISPQNSHIADILSEMGQAYGKLGNLEEELSHYKQALDFNLKLFPNDDHAHTAIFLSNVGSACTRLGKKLKQSDKLEEGLKYQTDALEMRQRLYPGNHPNIADYSLPNMAEACEALGQIDKAIDYYEQALEMQRELYLGNHSAVALSLNNLAFAYKAKGDMEQFLSYLKEALNMRQALYPYDHPIVATTLNSVGAAYHTKQDMENSFIYFEQALKMRQSLYQGNHPDVAESLNNVGIAYKAKGDNGKSLVYLEQSLKMFQEIYQSNHPNIAELLNKVGDAYLKLGDNAKNSFYHNGKLTIKQRGDIDEATIAVKQKIQTTILNEIHKLAVQGNWSNSSFYGIDWGIKGYLDEEYLKGKLGDLSKEPKNIEIAQTLIFEAINLSIMNSGEKDLTCAIEFSKKYPTLTKKIAVEHPEYFVDAQVARALIKDPVRLEQLIGTNFDGKGTFDHEQESYWYQYSRDGMDQLLKLRLKSTEVEGVKILNPNYVWDDSRASAEKLSHDIFTASINRQKTLVTLNLYGKHWVGIAVDQGESNIKVSYMDSEQQAIPILLKRDLVNILSAAYPNRRVDISETKLEHQKYNNCGLETIENLIAYVNGAERTVTQEGAMILHSVLLENALLTGEI
jgi:tetratricopeptide (TPR) repeat protein